MTHPTADELMDHLYGDAADPARHAEIEAHVAGCDECRRQLAAWGGVRRELAAWEVPPAPSRTRTVAMPSRAGSLMRWAVAAVVLLGTGYGFARVAAPDPVDASEVKTALARELREQLRGQLGEELRVELAAEQARFAVEQSRRHETFQRWMAEALSEMDARNVAAYAALRSDVETVAIQTQAEFEQLAVSDQPRTRSGPRDQ